jgi:hypothetical protein
MRVIAHCKGGPLDGAVFSVSTEDGKPGPLFSRYEAHGTLYVPDAPTDVPQPEPTGRKNWLGKTIAPVPLFSEEHDEAWSYVPSPEGERLHDEYLKAVENV